MVSGRVQCGRCLQWHFPKQAWAHVACVVVAPVVANAAPMVANPAPVVVHAETRHGKYKDPAARREYMRVLMRGKRAAKKNAKTPAEVAA